MDDKISEKDLISLLTEAAAQAASTPGLKDPKSALWMSIGLSGLSSFIKLHGLRKAAHLIMARVQHGAKDEAS